MKRNLTAFYLAFLLTFFSAINLYAQEEPQNSFPAFQILLTAELGYADNSDMDKWTKKYARDFADYEKTSFLVSNTSTNLEDTGKMAYGFDAEFRYFSGSIGFGAGSGYHFCQSKCVVNGESIFLPIAGEMGHFSLTFHVIPVTGTLYYRIPLNSSGFFLIGAGTGYYTGIMKAKAVNEGNEYQTGYLNNTYNSSAIGYHIKLEYSFLINNSFFSCGVIARQVRFKKFEDDENNNLTLDNANLIAGLTGVSFFIGAGTNL